MCDNTILENKVDNTVDIWSNNLIFKKSITVLIFTIAFTVLKLKDVQHAFSLPQIQNLFKKLVYMK